MEPSGPPPDMEPGGPPPSALGTHSGWLYKEGKEDDGEMRFKRLWCVVRFSESGATATEDDVPPRNVIFYEDDKSVEPQSVLSLEQGFFRVEKPKTRKKEYPHCFRLDVEEQGEGRAHEKKKVVLAADTAQAATEWKHALMAQKHDAKAEKAAAAELRASNAAARRPKRSLRKAPNSVDAVEDFLASHVRVSPPWPQQAPDPELCVCVLSVAKVGVAHMAGVQPGDLIVKVDREAAVDSAVLRHGFLQGRQHVYELYNPTFKQMVRFETARPLQLGATYCVTPQAAERLLRERYEGGFLSMIAGSLYRRALPENALGLGDQELLKVLWEAGEWGPLLHLSAKATGLTWTLGCEDTFPAWCPVGFAGGFTMPVAIVCILTFMMLSGIFLHDYWEDEVGFVFLPLAAFLVWRISIPLDTPALLMQAAALLESGQEKHLASGKKLLARFLSTYAHGFTPDYVAIATYYHARFAADQPLPAGVRSRSDGDEGGPQGGDLEGGLLDAIPAEQRREQLAVEAFRDLSGQLGAAQASDRDRVGTLLEELNLPCEQANSGEDTLNAVAASLGGSGGGRFPEYTLPVLNAPNAQVALDKVLGGMRPGQVLVVCVLGELRANPWYDMLCAKYLDICKTMAKYVSAMHVITARDEMAHRWAASETRAIQKGVSLSVLHDEGCSVARSLGFDLGTLPATFLLDFRGGVISVVTGHENFSVRLWDALASGNGGGAVTAI